MNHTTPSRPHKHSRRRARGMASFTAVVLVGTSAIALTMLAGITMAQSKRAANAQADAQLRQLLTAAEAYATVQTPDKADSLTPTLAPALGLQQAALHIDRTPASADTPATLTIRAALAERAATQKLALDPATGQWRLTELQLP